MKHLQTKITAAFVFCLLSFSLFAQDTSKLSLLEPAPAPNKTRLYVLGGSTGITYFGTLYFLNKLWYSQYPRSSFHFFNDNAEWLQVDKIGHSATAYLVGKYYIDLFRWAGMKDKKAIWIGGSIGSLYLTTIEILDGFSAKWGASPGDLLANSAGTALVISQELMWQEQRILMKFSSHKVKYPADVQQRANNLYGSSFQERVLKDYNGQTYWLSFNIAAFLNRESKFPKWLNIALGYGAEGMLGGFENKWEMEDGEIITRHDIPRYRQWFLSPDIDLSRIETGSKAANTALDLLNIVKIPAPAVELNKISGIQFHLVYF